MKKILLVGLILSGFACTKTNTGDGKTTDPTEGPKRCGIILETPTLDSFVAPTYYITIMIHFPEGDETIHLHGEVTGDHDGSWFLPRYDKDSMICVH
ncbi:MAG: hypothetical protein ABI366_04140 [Ginsengibacter sp.]